MKLQKKTTAIILMVLAFAVSFLGLNDNYIMKSKAASFDEINRPDVFLKQVNGDKQCTLVAATMLLRRAAMLSGNSNWADITADKVKKQAWVEGTGIKYTFTYEGITVNKASFGNDRVSEAIALLQRHPEGIVLFDQYRSPRSHAVLLTDYTDGIFYCADPSDAVPYGRIPVNQGLVRVEDSEFYYYVSNPNIPSATSSMTKSSNSMTVTDITSKTEVQPAAYNSSEAGSFSEADNPSTTDNPLTASNTPATNNFLTANNSPATDNSAAADKLPVTDNSAMVNNSAVTDVTAAANNIHETDISRYEISLSRTYYLYDGNEKRPKVTVAGLKENTDYTVSYLDNKEPGTAAAIITGIGTYSGVVIKNFKITDLAVQDYINEVAVNLTKKTIKRGKTAAVKVSFPENLTQVKAFSDNEQCINEVKISYSSSNSKIAKVNSKGKITAVKNGNAKINVTVELADGTKKVFTLAIKVK